MKVNFFWKGDNFDGFNMMCIKSHIKVGHEVIIWLSGNEPNSWEWSNIIPKYNNITIKNADTIFDVSKFIEDGGNLQTASDLWRFHFLYEYGGWYCDTDAYAIQHFPKSKDWIICSAEKDNSMLSIGVIKAPAKNPIFLECIKNIKHKWGNVKVFSEAYKNFYSNTNPTVINSEYYPWTWDKWDDIYKPTTIESLIINNNTKSIHLYHTMLKRNNVKFETVRFPCILNEMILWSSINE